MSQELIDNMELAKELHKDKITGLLDLNGTKLINPNGIMCEIDPEKGIGKVTLQYTSNPDDCYQAYEEIRKNYKGWNFI